MNAYENAVNTDGLTRKFGDFTAVDQVDFYIPKGEIFGLLGPNGAGKTTTIRMLCGIIAPTAGSATVLGYDIHKQVKNIKKNIGYMSQRFSLYNDLTAYENIDFYASIYGLNHGNKKQRIEELIDQSGLRDYQGELSSNLSGAWRQRLALACAIAHDPPMVFLDEPTAGVDPVSRREFWNLIYQMAGRGVSVLATTHYMDEADYCNKIGMMYKGRIVAIASPDTFKNDQPGVLVQVSMADPIKGEEIAEQVSGVMGAALHGISLHITVENKAVIPTLKAAFDQAQLIVDEIEIIQPSLEDVFINMVENQMQQNGRSDNKELGQ